MNGDYAAHQAKEKYIHGIFSAIAPSYEFINHVLSFNLDRLWRRKAISRFYQPSHAQILDACCGTGELTELLRHRLPAHGSITGVDFCESMLDIARVRHQNIKDVRYEVANIQQLPFSAASFDAVYNCFALRNLSDIPGAVREMCRVIRPGGQLVIIDLTLPESFLWRWYLMNVVPFLGRLCHGDEGPYSYLSASIQKFCRPLELRERLVAVGLHEVEYVQYLGGVVTAVSGTVR